MLTYDYSGDLRTRSFGDGDGGRYVLSVLT